MSWIKQHLDDEIIPIKKKLFQSIIYKAAKTFFWFNSYSEIAYIQNSFLNALSVQSAHFFQCKTKTYNFEFS